MSVCGKFRPPHAAPLRSRTYRAFALLALSAVTLLSAACSRTPLDHDVYVWQRKWTPALQDALAQSADTWQRVRVLAVQWPESGAPIEIDLQSAAATLAGRQVVLVMRVEGARVDTDPTQVAKLAQAQVQRLVATGGRVVALEIDHDTATSRVADYAAWLARLPTQDPIRGLPIWITALPDWRHSKALHQLLDTADSYTLQVHATLDPSSPLMDVEQARDWVMAFAKTSATPFFVSLPAYQLMAGMDANGQVRFVEAEARVAGRAEDERLLFTSPLVLQGWLANLDTWRPHTLRGIAWFRLPSVEDRQALSLPTLLALVTATPLQSKLRMHVTPTRPGAATFDLALHNAGPHDAELPAQISVPTGCRIGDGAAGYRALDAQPILQRHGSGLLRAGSRLGLGWARCDPHESGEWHVEI